MKLDEAAAVLSSSAQVSQGCEITIERKDEMELPLKSNPKANRALFQAEDGPQQMSFND